ncbi:hypothetical protein [Legionella bononiensis]|uniref:Uncharacterized protein n=1 Tax=Legionella bononiensis TaxID=2793102 RepID=A0ABS1W8V4_9GAMM|nr:hypothetical protein [Legionella bononiensis]MBL7479696.1 hypothetical protein [Legionella bononiensis]MBL7525792.1 hypothetical protein [Legionella bononiensis]MBL7561974.1 hypothetical protein [Legionella bononiensis]
MPFNIELLKPEYIVKLQVYKKTISVYFRGEDSYKVERAKAHWEKVEKGVVGLMPEYNPHWLRGRDSVHIKRNHTNEHEVPIRHSHREFNCDVSPTIFSEYLLGMWNYQNTYPDVAYEGFLDFFENKTEVDNILNTFDKYYQEYHGSPEESAYNEETKLSEAEEKEYAMLFKPRS